MEFNVEYDVSLGRQIIINVSGWLIAADGTALGGLFEDPMESAQAQQLAAQGSVHDRNYGTTSKRVLRLISNLTPEGTAHIEKCRSADAKNDVRFVLELKVQTITTDVQIAQYYPIKRDDLVGQVVPGAFKVRLLTGREIEAQPIVRAYAGSDYQGTSVDGWVLSGFNGPVFLSANVQKSSLPYRISAGDWVHDFAAKVGLRARFLVEVPVSDGRLPGAEAYITKAEEAMARWDTKSIFANCRELGVFLDGELKAKLGMNSFAYKERWGRAYDKFNHRASLDLHLEQIRNSYPGDKTAEIDRGDCEALLYSAKILLKYALDLLR